MKKVIYLFLAFIILSVISCKKILEKSPLDFYSELENYYNTPEKLDANIRAVYDVLQSSVLYGSSMQYMLGLEADEGYYSRESYASAPYSYDFTSGHSHVSSTWSALYLGVARANNFITNVDANPEIDAELRGRLKGEALFLRGYYYFMLVKTFGGVPLILEPLKNVEDIDVAKATAKEVYEQILTDMREAEPLVAGIREIGHGGRINKSAVRGILARVCLHMAGYPVRDLTKYQEAKDWAYKVISDASAGHELNPSFSQIFINYAQDKYDTKESIWEIEFKGNGQDAFTETGGLGYLTGPISTSDVIGQCFGGVRATSKLYEVYAGGDLRRDWTIASFAYSGSNHDFSGAYSTSLTQTYLNNRHAGKFRREYETLKPKHRTQTPQNFPLLRYADVLLMYAEADFEAINKGEADGIPNPEAVGYVEQVRSRSMVVGGIRTFVYVNNTAGRYTVDNPPRITIAPPAGGTAASISVTVAANGSLNLPTVDRDPVTGFKMGSGYTGTPRVVITPTVGTVYATIRTHPVFTGLTADEKDNFRKTIQDERMREFAFETIRKGDLIRWNILPFEMRQVANKLNTAGLSARYYYNFFANVREKHNLWPIPARELNLNRKLVQNPGW